MPATDYAKDLEEAKKRLDALDRNRLANLAERLAHFKEYAKLQEEFQKDRDEYIDDMSLGGKTYRPPR